MKPNRREFFQAIGAGASGENRFLPLKEPQQWAEVYPTVWWGNSAPQNMKNRYANRYQSFADHWNYDDVSEDCLLDFE